LLIKLNLHVNWIIVLFGAFVAGSMALVVRRYQLNKKHHDLDALIGIDKHTHEQMHQSSR
jgi:hypothetical protein